MKTPQAPTSNVGEQAGYLFVLSAPSGAGKTTICQELRRRFPDIRYSVSSTTRRPRSGEKNGMDYHFISEAEFNKGIKHRNWAEWARVHGQYYGTSAVFIDEQLAEGNDLLLDIDVQGTAQIVDRYPGAVTIFIVPPSLEELRRRLESRGKDRQDEIERRLEVAKAEMTEQDSYKHIIVNDQLSIAVEELISIVESYRTGYTFRGSRRMHKDPVNKKENNFGHSEN